MSKDLTSPKVRPLLRRLKANMFRDANRSVRVRPSEGLRLQFPVVKQKVCWIPRTKHLGIVKHAEQLRHGQNCEGLLICTTLSAHAHNVFLVKKTLFESPRGLLVVLDQLRAHLHFVILQVALHLEVQGLQVQVQSGAHRLDKALLERPIAEESSKLVFRRFVTASDHQPLGLRELTSHQPEEIVKPVDPGVLGLHQVNTKAPIASCQDHPLASVGDIVVGGAQEGAMLLAFMINCCALDNRLAPLCPCEVQ